MDTNSIYSKPMYKCGVCGNTYESIAERMNCEQACLKKQEEEAKKAAEAKKNAEKDVRKAEVHQAIKNASDLIHDYIEDYGYFDYRDNCGGASSFNAYSPLYKFFDYFM